MLAKGTEAKDCGEGLVARRRPTGHEPPKVAWRTPYAVWISSSSSPA